MQVVAISDTHLQHRRVPLPGGDVLVHAGDFSEPRRHIQLHDFINWMAGQPHPLKILVAGNHDEMPPGTGRLMAESGIIYLQDELVEAEGFKVYGSPWTPIFYDWHFMASEEVLAERFALIPEGVDLLVTHGSPGGVLDLSLDGRRCGSTALARRVQEARPRFHVFGHIHEGAGQSAQFEETACFNVSVLDVRYRLCCQATTIVL